MRALLGLLVLALLGTTAGCAATPDGTAQRARAETDDLARALLPRLVDGEVRLNPGRVAFVRCDVSGWRYEGDADLLGTLDPAVVADVLAELGLEVERRDDGSVVGRRGELSALVGRPLGPPARPFRHVTLTHACARYSEADSTYAEQTPAGDYAAYVPEERVVTG